jgi:hypothetical protein
MLEAAQEMHNNIIDGMNGDSSCSTTFSGEHVETDIRGDQYNDQPMIMEGESFTDNQNSIEGSCPNEIGDHQFNSETGSSVNIPF